MKDFSVKIGDRIIALWDGANSEIISIENDIVVYKCLSYDNSESSDGLYRSPIEELNKYFTKESK